MIRCHFTANIKYGSITQNFLQLSTQNLQYEFPASRPNVMAMFTRATTHPCPIGILKTADAMWKTNKPRKFFGYSYTSPTPLISTIQQLGLGITKAFSSHIRNATKAAHATALQLRRDQPDSFSRSGGALE